MHSYLPAIGFREVRKKAQLSQLIESVLTSPDSLKAVPYVEDSCYVVMTKEVAEGAGLAICGETDTSGRFEMEYYFPYIMGTESSTNEECDIRRQIEKEAYSGICDDLRLGLNLIFFVNNFMEYKKAESLKGFWPKTSSVCLSALSVCGTVLLPIEKTENEKELAARENFKCMKLMEAARRGDQNAVEDLTVRDMNLYNRVSSQAHKKDLYSIIETFFMPCGVECDQYSVMGYITDCRKTRNKISGEELYIMDILCNDLPIHLMMNCEDLLGEPKAGYRFKGDIWLQGTGILS